MVDAQEIHQIAMSLPEVEYENGGWSFRKKGIAWYYRQKVAGMPGRLLREDVLAVRVAGEDEKQMLIAADPDTFFTDDHYRGYPAVLVRLAAVETDEMAELLTDAWRLRASKRMVAAFDADRKNRVGQDKG